jgi:hypothetical protein
VIRWTMLGDMPREESAPQLFPPGRPRPTLVDWIHLVAVHQRDEECPDAELRRRDRRIGRMLAPLGDRPLAKLIAWQRAVRSGESVRAAPSPSTPAEEQPPSRGTTEAVRLAALVLAAAGFAVGAAAAAGALSYQPLGRINAVAALALLVGLPWLFLGLALINALPSRVRRFVPWIGSEPEGGGLLQPARWALRALPQSTRERLDAAWGRGQAWERITAPLRRWLLLSISQGAGVALQLGALTATLALVVFSDLSFGWSTTLEVDALSVRRFTEALSLPWAQLWPEARPSLELVETTRFFRIAGGPDPAVPLETYGGWWPFLVMAMVVYGLLPRAIFFAVARGQLQRALRRAFLEAPGSARALDRLDSPLLETTGDHDDSEAGSAAGPTREADCVHLPSRAVVVSWAEACAATGAVPLRCAPVASFDAGGPRSPAEDTEVARRAAATAVESGVPIVLAVRGFEPPLAEVFDFLRELRDALGSGHAVLVTLLGGGPVERGAWQQRVAAAGDPWLQLANPFRAGETSAP